MVHRFERTGVLVEHGAADRLHRPDAVDFQARSGQVETDWLADVHVWIDRWPTRTGVAELFVRRDGEWELCANAMPFDAIQVLREQEVHLVFSVWVPLVAGVTYRLHLPGAVLTRPTVRIAAIDRLGRIDGREPRRRPAPRAATRRAS